MDPEFKNIEPTLGETKAQRTERLFTTKYHHSFDESLSLVHLQWPQALQEMQTLIEAHKIGKHRLDKFLIKDRLEHYIRETIGQLSREAAKNPGEVDRYLLNPKANVLSLIELNLGGGGGYSVYADVVKWQLSPERVQNSYILSQYQYKMGNATFKKDDEENRNEKIPLYTKPLQDLTDDDFLNLLHSQNHNLQPFTMLVSAIAVFQAAQKALDPELAVKNDNVPPEGREALSLIERLQKALRSPDVALAVAKTTQAQELAKTFDALGIGRAGGGNQAAVPKLGKS